jgi:hypothetical protein
MFVGGKSKRFKGALPGFIYADLPDLLPCQKWTAKGMVTDVKDQGDRGEPALILFASSSRINATHKHRSLNETISVYIFVNDTQHAAGHSLPRQQWRASTLSRPTTSFPSQRSSRWTAPSATKTVAATKVTWKRLSCTSRGKPTRRARTAPAPIGGSLWNGGITTESAYPYQQSQRNCTASGKPVAATIRGFQYVPANNETALRLAVSQQPVSVALNGKSKTFVHYKGGIFGANGETCHVGQNHAAVGYGTDEHGTKYWLMKNSWGTEWGYMRMARDVQPAGLCGLAAQASYPAA